MQGVHGGSGVDRRLLSLAALTAACLLALTACGSGDDTSGSTGSGGGAGSGSGAYESPSPPLSSLPSSFPSTAPSPTIISSASTGGSQPLGARVTCPNSAYLQPEAVPASLTGVLLACRSAKGEILLKNDSAVQLRVQPAAATSLDTPVRASDGFSDIVNAELAASASSVDAVRVPPGGYVIAYSSTAPVQVRVDVSLPDASQAYAASVIGRYVQSKLATPSQRLASSVATCAEDAGQVWARTRQPGQLDLDQLLAETALGPVLSCRNLVTEVSQLTGEEAPAAEGDLAREFKALPTELGATVWDDLLTYVRKLVTLAH